MQVVLEADTLGSQFRSPPIELSSLFQPSQMLQNHGYFPRIMNNIGILRKNPCVFSRDYAEIRILFTEFRRLNNFIRIIQKRRMNSETTYSAKAEIPFVRNPSKFQAVKKAHKNTFRRLIVLANIVSALNILGYFFGNVGELNFVIRFSSASFFTVGWWCVTTYKSAVWLVFILQWRTEVYAVQFSKMMAEIMYNKFGLDLFVHHVCMFLFFFLVPQRFLWLGPQGNLIHVPLLFQNMYFLYRHNNVRQAKFYSGLFWSLWLPVVAYRNSVAFCLGFKYVTTGQAFGRALMGLGALGTTLDVFWTREFILTQLSTYPNGSQWAKTVTSFYKSPLCLLLLAAGAYMAWVCVYSEVELPRLQFFISVVVIVLCLNWKNLNALRRPREAGDNSTSSDDGRKTGRGGRSGK
eukprot:jgi/Bigna1/82629/fgenesh1_pg.95_\